MLEPEHSDPEFFLAIERFITQQKEDKDTANLEAAAEVVRNLLSNDWEATREEVLQLARFWTLRSDYAPRVVLQEQAVKRSPKLTAQNQKVLGLIDRLGYATEGIYRIAQSDRGATHIPRTASIRQIPLPLPIDKISLDQFTSEGIRYMSEVTDALGIQATDGPFTRISITGVASGLSDRQTRPAMEQIFLRCSTAAQTLAVGINTSYYFFGDRIGKVVNRPAPLLAGRALDSKSCNFSAMSEFTSGDEFLARVALKALDDKLSSLI